MEATLQSSEVQVAEQQKMKLVSRVQISVETVRVYVTLISLRKKNETFSFNTMG